MEDVGCRRCQRASRGLFRSTVKVQDLFKGATCAIWVRLYALAYKRLVTLNTPT
jgi:hypothetical protein